MDVNELSIHEKYMSRCIEIAKKNSSKYYPNPSVGALIVKNNTIIAEGVTSDYGCNHAEVNAINSIKDPNDLIESTLYVTLEPCSHFGKTPPCVSLIHKSKIKNVVIGTLDNSSKVNGKGVSFLKEREINVKTGILEKNNLIFGGAGISKLKHTNENICELQKMYFLKNARGLGLGDKMIDLCLMKAKEFGYDKCYIETMFNMKSAQKLYLKKGFYYLNKPKGNTGHSSCPVWMIKDLK